MENTPTPYEALLQAVDLAGSQSELARISGVSQPTVWKWLNSSKRLPAEHVLHVEAVLGVSRHHLRPDIYPLGLKEGAPFPFLGQGISEAAPAVAFNRGPILQSELAK